MDQSCQTGACKVAVPYAFDATPWAHIPALSTDRYAFWITNPSMAMYYAVNQWCRGFQGVLQYVIESSYSSIQIWRFDPYEYCPIVDGVRKCPPDTSATYRTLPGFVSGDFDANQVCIQTFYVVAPAITYVNEYNLALTVLETTFANVDTETLRPIDPSKARCTLRGFGGFFAYWRFLFVFVKLLQQKLDLVVCGRSLAFNFLSRKHKVHHPHCIHRYQQ